MSEEKVLNFYPFYENLIKTRQKHMTLRLGRTYNGLRKGEKVKITVGWNPPEVTTVCRAIIADIQLKKIRELKNQDLIGESPDCDTKEAVPYVLSAIYRKVVTDEDYVTLIRWHYDEEG